MISNTLLRRAAPCFTKSLLTRQVGTTIGSRYAAAFTHISASRNFSTVAPVQAEVSTPKLSAITPEVADKILAEFKSVDANFDGRYVSFLIKLAMSRSQNRSPLQ